MADPTLEGEEGPKLDRDAYIRWQQYAITQLGYTINFIFTIASAVLGLITKELIERKIVLNGNEWVPFGLFKWAFGLLAFSTAVAVLANITRALDFRFTRRAALERLRKEEMPRLKSQEWSERWGRYTWRLFYLQIALFWFGMACLGLSVWEGIVSMAIK